MLRPIAPFIEYAVNYDYISEVLCINKNKPELSCKGKCYVMQKLEKQRQDDFNSLEISLKEYPIGFVEILSIEKLPKIYTTTSTVYFHQNNYSFQLMKLDEHPPELA